MGFDKSVMIIRGLGVFFSVSAIFDCITWIMKEYKVQRENITVEKSIYFPTEFDKTVTYLFEALRITPFKNSSLMHSSLTIENTCKCYK